MLEDTNFSPDEPPQFQMESRDARLLAQYLWMAYLDTPVTEYQQFLWQKIMQQTMEHARTDLKMMSRYLQSISPERIDATNINQYLRNQKIIALTGADYPTFVEELKTSLLAFASDPVQQEKSESPLPAAHPSDRRFLRLCQRLDARVPPGIPPLLKHTHTCCRMLKDFMDSPEEFTECCAEQSIQRKLRCAHRLLRRTRSGGNISQKHLCTAVTGTDPGISGRGGRVSI